MPDMKVKDLIEILQQIDPELPIHRRIDGEYPVCKIDYAGYWLNYETLMQNESDLTYFASVDEPCWKNHKEQFKEPFKAVVID